MKWLDNIKSKAKPKATDDKNAGAANDSQQNKDYQKIASKKYKKELRKSPYKLISNLKIQDVKPSVLRSQLHELANNPDTAGALRQVKQGYLVVLISEQNLIDAGYSATNRESKQRYGQFTAALQKRKLRSATLLGDKLNGYVAIVPDNYKDNDEGITSLQLLLSYVNFNTVGLHWGLFKNDYDDNSLNNTNEVLDTTVTLDQLKKYSDDHTPLHIEGNEVVEGPDTTVDNSVSQGEHDTNKATNPSSNAITTDNTLNRQSNNQQSNNQQSNNQQSNQNSDSTGDNKNPDLTVNSNKPDLTGDNKNPDLTGDNRNGSTIDESNQRQNSGDLLAKFDNQQANQNNDNNQQSDVANSNDNQETANADDYNDLGLTDDDNANNENLSDEDKQFQNALDDSEPKTRVEEHQEDNEENEPAETNEEFANRLAQFDETTFYDNDLDLQVDLNPLKNMLLVHQPKRFALKPIEDDNQKLDKMLNRQRQQANDKLTEMVGQATQTIYNNAYNELQRAITNAEQEYSLIDAKTKFGHLQKEIDDTMDKRRADSKRKIVLHHQQLDADYQKLLDKKASLAAEQARLDYDELHKDDLQRRKDAYANQVAQKIDDDQIKFSTDLKTKRNNDANVYVHQLMTVVMERAQKQLDILDSSVDKVYALEQQTMTNLMSNNYKDEVSRQQAVAEEIKHDNTIDRLHQDIKRLNQDNADKIKEIQANCDDKIASIRANSDQVLHQHEQQYNDDTGKLHQQLQQIKDQYAQDMKLKADSLNEKDDELSRMRADYDAKLEKTNRDKDIILDKFTKSQLNEKRYGWVRTGVTSAITLCAGFVIASGVNMLHDSGSKQTNTQPTTSIIQIPSQNSSSNTNISSSSSENVPTSNSSSTKKDNSSSTSTKHKINKNDNSDNSTTNNDSSSSDMNSSGN